MEEQITKIDDVKEEFVQRDFQEHSTEISAPSGDNSVRVINQIDVIVNMRKDLHHILVKLDELEEKFRRQTQYQESRRGPSRHQDAHAVYDIPPRRSSSMTGMSKEEFSDISDISSEITQKEEQPKVKEIRKNTRELRAFAMGLFCVTVVSIGVFFVFTLLFGIPEGREKLEQSGITYDQFKSMLNWLVPGFVMYLGAWTIFGILYLQSTKKK